MPPHQYDRRDIPRELQRLLDHTDRGIERLYHLAGRGTDAAAESAALASERSRQKKARLQVNSSRSLSKATFEGQRNGADHRTDGYAGPSSWSHAEDATAFQRLAHRRIDAQCVEAAVSSKTPQMLQDVSYSSSSDSNASETLHPTEMATKRRNARGKSRHRDRGSASDESGSDATDMPPSVFHHGQRSAAPPTRGGSKTAAWLTERSPVLAQSKRSPLSTPHRTLNFSSGTMRSSPASLEKPPMRPAHQVNLQPPPAATIDSYTLQNSFETGAEDMELQRQPPWRRRRQLHWREDDAPSSAPANSLLHQSSVANSALSGRSLAETPLSGTAAASEAAAYRFHVAAQQSTQKPSVSAAVGRRQYLQRTRDADAKDPTASPFTSRVSMRSHSRDYSAVLDQSFAESAEARDPRSGTSPSMLSQFGRRWGGIFRDILTDPSSVAKGTGRSRSTSLSSSSSIAAEGVPQPGRPARKKNTASKTRGKVRHRDKVTRASPLIKTENASTAVAQRSSDAAPTSPPLLADARIVEQLRAELRSREEAMVHLRMEHAQELAELRQTLSHERTNASKESTADLAATFAANMEFLQSSLQTERERLAETMEQLRMARLEAAQRQIDCETARHTLETLQVTYATAVKSQKEEAAQVQKWRTQAETAAAAAAATAQLESQVKVWKAREVDWQAREAQLQQLARDAEEQRGRQEAAAQSALAKVEAEFTQTSEHYHALLADATKRLSSLEKSHRKYKALKETHATFVAEHEELVDTSARRAQDFETQIASLRAEAAELRQQLCQRDVVTQQESSSHQEMLNEYKKRLELQEAGTAEQVKAMQQQAETANHTIELLRTQLDNLKQEIREEQSMHQQTHMKLAQAELKWKETQHEQQNSAAAYKVRSEETIAQLKRQIHEKDVKMQALAASAAEPVQRLRQQLEDERGRRARLEEQFRAYKKKAKEAEELAASEMRREQLRTALLTPKTASPTSTHYRFVRSTTATPSPPSTATSHRAFADPFSDDKTDRNGEARGCTLSGRSMAARQPTVTVASFDARGARPGQHSKPAVAFSSSSSLPSTAPAVHSDARDAAVDDTDGRTTSPRPHPAQPSMEKEQPAVARYANPILSSDHFHSQQQPSQKPDSRDIDDDRRLPISPSAASCGADACHDVSDIYPSATVESLSVISRQSPYVSTFLIDEERDDLPVHGSESAAGEGGRHVYRPDRRAEGRAGVPATSELQSPPRGESPPSAFDGTVTTQVFEDASVQAHEHRMHSFHASASEVLRRIAESREEVFAQCAAIVKSAAATSRQKVAASRPNMGEGTRSGRKVPVSPSRSSSSTTLSDGNGSGDTVRTGSKTPPKGCAQ